MAQKMTNAGVETRQAQAMAEAFRDATEHLVTKEMLRAEMATLRAEMHSALRTQTYVIVGSVAALVTAGTGLIAVLQYFG